MVGVEGGERDALRKIVPLAQLQTHTDGAEVRAYCGGKECTSL